MDKAKADEVKRLVTSELEQLAAMIGRTPIDPDDDGFRDLALSILDTLEQRRSDV